MLKAYKFEMLKSWGWAFFCVTLLSLWVLISLLPPTSFRMRQVNIVGTSPPSLPSRRIQTLQAPPDVSPANITLRTASETSLWLRWMVSRSKRKKIDLAVVSEIGGIQEKIKEQQRLITVEISHTGTVYLRATKIWKESKVLTFCLECLVLGIPWECIAFT